MEGNTNKELDDLKAQCKLYELTIESLKKALETERAGGIETVLIMKKLKESNNKLNNRIDELNKKIDSIIAYKKQSLFRRIFK